MASNGFGPDTPPVPVRADYRLTDGRVTVVFDSPIVDNSPQIPGWTIIWNLRTRTAINVFIFGGRVRILTIGGGLVPGPSRISYTSSVGPGPFLFGTNGLKVPDFTDFPLTGV